MTKHSPSHRPLALAALLALAAPATLAQPVATPLTPPAVLGAAKTIQFTLIYVSAISHKDGRVVKSIVGYEEGGTALEDALKAAGAA